MVINILYQSLPSTNRLLRIIKMFVVGQHCLLNNNRACDVIHGVYSFCAKDWDDRMRKRRSVTLLEIGSIEAIVIGTNVFDILV